MPLKKWITRRPPRPDHQPVTVRKPLTVDREIRSPDYDTLDWSTHARRLGEFLVFRTDTPVTLGIQGDWGSGKSSFINLIEATLGQQQPAQTHETYYLAPQLHHYHCTDPEDPATTAHAYVLRFDSWTFAQSSYEADDLFPLYVTQVIEHYLRACGRFQSDTPTFRSLMQWGSKVGRLALTAVANVAGDATSEAVQRELANASTQAVDMLSSFKTDFQRLVNNLLAHDGMHYPDRLIIIVDDLDRIAPRSAVELTEKIKVLLDVQGVVFVLSADLTIIQEGLRDKFGDAASASHGKPYLDKIVKIQYPVPPLTAHDLVNLARGYRRFCSVFGLAPDTTPDSLTPTLPFQLLRAFPDIGGNIRNSKRVFTNFEFRLSLSRATESASPPRLALPLLALTILTQYDDDLARRFHHWAVRQEGPVPWPSSDEPLSPAAFAARLCAELGYTTSEPQELMAIGTFFTLLQPRQYTPEEWRTAGRAAALGAGA
jgi:hypothetical protein